MDHDLRRQLIILLAGLGMLVAALHLAAGPAAWTALPPLPALHVASAAPSTPRAALADTMKAFELSLFNGSPYSVEALRSVDQICRDHADDATIDRACAQFSKAAQPHADPRAIDDAIRLLENG